MVSNLFNRIVRLERKRPTAAGLKQMTDADLEAHVADLLEQMTDENLEAIQACFHDKRWDDLYRLEPADLVRDLLRAELEKATRQPRALAQSSTSMQRDRP